jgi:hypothetical protein
VARKQVAAHTKVHFAGELIKALREHFHKVPPCHIYQPPKVLDAGLSLISMILLYTPYVIAL